MILRTERLVLRRARESDLEDLHRVLSNEDAMRYWSTPPHATMQRTRDWLASMLSSTALESEDFVIEHDGRVIGKLGSYRLPDVGFILAHDRWGMGLASEAMRAFLDHVFTRPDVDWLRADVDPRNAPSLRLLERFGFVETHRASRTWETHLGWCDSVYLRLDKARP